MRIRRSVCQPSQWLLLAFAGLFHALGAHAAEPLKPQVVTGIAWGTTQLSFSEKLDADTTFNTVTGSVAVSLGKTYATLSYATDISEENVSEEDELGRASRDDLDITLGYRFNDHWAAFLGYKRGSTDLDLTQRDTTITQSEYYKEDGLYLGASYSWRFKRAGILSLTGAYIRFDSDLKFTAGEDDPDEDDPIEFDDLSGKFSGDADGYSVGVSWVMPIGNSLAVRAQYKINEYDLEVKSDAGTFRPDQKFKYFDIGLMYAW